MGQKDGRTGEQREKRQERKVKSHSEHRTQSEGREDGKMKRSEEEILYSMYGIPLEMSLNQMNLIGKVKFLFFFFVF